MEAKRNGNSKKHIKGDYKVTTTMPDDVVDAQSWAEYVKLTQSPELNEDRYHLTSEGNDIDLMSAHPTLMRIVQHLPEEEQQAIFDKSSVRRSLIARVAIAKRKAFGHQSKFGARADVTVGILDKKENEIIELSSRFFTAQEIHRICLEEWGYDVSIRSIEKIRIKNVDKIKQMQEAYKSGYTDMRLYHKRSRLEELHILYNDRKARYTTSGNQNDYRLLLQTIAQIQKEVEGDKLTIEGSLDINLEVSISLAMQRETMKMLNIIDIILGRVAARYNANPSWLIAKMHASHYAKFNNLINQVQYEDEVLYPSEMPFDFDEIKRKHNAGTVTTIPVVPLNKPVNVEQQKKAEDIKAKLREFLNTKEKKINASVIAIQDKVAEKNAIKTKK